MWRFPEEIRADLESGEPERISAGLRDLADAMDSVDEFELPPLDIGLLVPFGDTIPSEVQHTLARILAGYRSFQPSLEREDVLYRLAELAIVYGDDRAALDASMAVKISADAPAMVTRVLDRVRERGLRSPREVTGVGNYLSYLLDGKPSVREATIAALTRWRGGLLDQAIQYIHPQLEEHESQQLYP